MSERPSYLRVFLTFLRNSVIRDMMFPANFIIETISSFGWVMMNIGFYLLIFTYTDQIQPHFPAGSDDTDAVAKYYSVTRAEVTSDLVEKFLEERQAGACDKYQ